MTKTVADQLRADIATVSKANASIEKSLETLTRAARELRGDSALQDTFEYPPEDLEARMSEARLDLERGRVLQSNLEMLLSSSGWWAHTSGLS